MGAKQFLVRDESTGSTGYIESEQAGLALSVVSGSALGAANGQRPLVQSGALIYANPDVLRADLAPYSVKFDRFVSSGASMSSVTNPTHLTVSNYTFTTADIDKVVKVVGAAAAGANLKTTITGVSAGKAVLALPCLTTVAGATTIFGTDNAVALAALFADLSAPSAPYPLARTCVMPAGCALYSGTLYLPRVGTIKGVAENWINYDLMYSKSGAEQNQQGTTLYQMWDQNVDCVRVTPQVSGSLRQWQGRMVGFTVAQDWDNTAGKGIAFRDSANNAVLVIDGGQLERVAVMGAASAGFEFPVGCVTATFRDLYAFACGYGDRRDFTADMTSGSGTLSNVSSFTGLAQGSIISHGFDAAGGSGLGVPADSIVQSTNEGAGTLLMNSLATATATGVAIQAAGSAGVIYTCHGAEAVHFDGLSGDQNSGGLLRMIGTGGTPAPGAVTITNLKNEFGVNVYRSAIPAAPQGAHAIVLDRMQGTRVSIRGLINWADASSSVGGTTPNALGRWLGAAILILPTDSAAPQINWEGVAMNYAAGSGQNHTTLYVLRDTHSSNIQPILYSLISGRGGNLSPTVPVRLVADVNATLRYDAATVAWSTLTAARTATLPLLSEVPVGAQITLMDLSGSASTALTITAAPAGGDTLSGATTIADPYGRLVLVSQGTRWVGIAPVGYENDHGGTGLLAPGAEWITGSPVAPTAQRVYYARFVVKRRRPVSGVQFVVTTAESTDVPVHVGILDLAGNRIVTSGAVTGKLNSTGTKVASFTPQVLEPGVYLASWLGTSAVSALVLLFASAGNVLGWSMNGANPPERLVSWQDAQSSIPNPATFTTPASANGAPMMLVV